MPVSSLTPNTEFSRERNKQWVTDGVFMQHYSLRVSPQTGILLYLIFLFLRLESLLVADEFLLHEQVVFDSLQLQELQPATGVWGHCGTHRQS